LLHLYPLLLVVLVLVVEVRLRRLWVTFSYILYSACAETALILQGGPKY